MMLLWTDSLTTLPLRGWVVRGGHLLNRRPAMLEASAFIWFRNFRFEKCNKRGIKVLPSKFGLLHLPCRNLIATLAVTRSLQLLFEYFVVEAAAGAVQQSGQSKKGDM